MMVERMGGGRATFGSKSNTSRTTTLIQCLCPPHASRSARHFCARRRAKRHCGTVVEAAKTAKHSTPTVAPFHHHGITTPPYSD
ncbi:hypothetical protein L1887_50628 [Cichorium endivia]|nr:hypothetical protein L1887_50628 [Cichorium endivia]